MNRVSLLFCGIAAASAAYASPILFDFEDQALGDYTSLNLVQPGLSVELKRESGSELRIIGITPTLAASYGWGSRTLVPGGDQDLDRAMIMNFSLPVTSVSFQLGDFGVDEDVAYLEAYVDENTVGFVDSTTLDLGLHNLNNEVPLSLTLTSATPFRSVRFNGGGSNFPSSLFWDNLQVTPVPEPASMLALGAGLAALAARRRRRK
jgi:hypothetical protein